jgi:hypothetical protein
LFKDSRKSLSSVKDSRRSRRNREILSAFLPKIQEQIMKKSLNEIIERFTNLSSTGVKNASQAQRTAIEAVKFVLRTVPRRETRPEGTRRARKKAKEFQPSDLEHRPDSR